MYNLSAASPHENSAGLLNDIEKCTGGRLIIQVLESNELFRLQAFSRDTISLAFLANLLKTNYGWTLPGTNQVTLLDSFDNNALIIGAAPGEFIVQLTPALAKDFLQTLSGLKEGASEALYTASLITDSRSCFVIAGEAAVDLLAMGSSVDFHPSAFQVGHSVTTRFAKLAVMIIPLSQSGEFLIIVDRSAAAYLASWIRDAAEQLTSSLV